MAESFMVEAFSREIGIVLKKTKRKLDDATVELDAFGEGGGRCVVAEVFARLAKPKAGQKKKILTDALKLVFVCESLRQQNPDQKVEAYLVFASDKVERAVTGEAWAAAALRKFGIKTKLIELTEPLKTQVAETEKLQATGNSASA